MEKQNKRGGARPGAGRPKKAETKTISFRVPKMKAEKLQKQIKTIINEQLQINGSR